jgi:nucleoside-diphosphate-sugar epimerase
LYNILKTSPQILVTGGAGYLGSILVPLLIDRGFRVHVIDRFYFGNNLAPELLNHPALRITDEDIFFHENWPDLFKDTHAVVHLASISNDPSCDLDPNLSIQTNFLATMSLARRAQAEGVKHFVFMSSCSVYGASGQRFLDERSATGPVTLYALTKLQSERELLRLSAHNFAVTVLRSATLFGASPRMRFDLAVNAMTKRALQGQNIIINGNGAQYRPFLHVKDAAESIAAVLLKDRDDVAGEVFNIGNERLNYSIAELAQIVGAQFPEVKIEHREDNHDLRSYRVRYRRFQNRCGFAPARTIEEGIKEIADAYRNGQLPDMDAEQFYNVSVMKKACADPLMRYSLASAPRWASKEPLLQSKNNK